MYISDTLAKKCHEIEGYYDDTDSLNLPHHKTHIPIQLS